MVPLRVPALQHFYEKSVMAVHLVNFRSTQTMVIIIIITFTVSFK